MSRYPKPVRLLMRDLVAEFGLQPGQVLTRQQVLDWFQSRYPLIKTGTIYCHLTRMSTNVPSRVHHNPKPKEDDLFFYLGDGRYRLYDPQTDPPPIYKSDPRPEPAMDEPGKETQEFAYESDLRDFLGKNLSLLEAGLRLYVEEEGTSGIEYPAGSGYVDILAVDRDGNYVVVKLKVSKGYDRVIGQLLYYMAWIERNLAEDGQKVRGMIVAREISDSLRLACSKLPEVDLFEYKLSISVNKVPK